MSGLVRSGSVSKPSLCQDCQTAPPESRVALQNPQRVVWLCSPCAKVAKQNLEAHGTIRPSISSEGETKVFAGESHPDLCDHCHEVPPSRRIARTKYRVKWLCDDCAETAKQQFHQVGTIRPRAVGVGGNRSWTPDELEMLVIKMQKPHEKGGLKVTKRRFITWTFDRAFVGADFVDWCLENFVVQTRGDACEVGRLLLANNFISHIMDLFTFKDGNHLYRFAEDGAPAPGQTPPFDMALGALMTTHAVEAGRSVPTLVEACCAYLEENGMDREGLYRLSGNQADIEARRGLYNRGRSIIYDRATDPHEVAGLLKLWVRSMPEPLIPTPFQARFADAIAARDGAGQDEGSPGFDQSIRDLAALVAELPPYHRFTLARIMSHLSVVAAHEAKTKMPAKNLAMVMGPNVLRAGASGPAPGSFNALTVAVAVTYRMITRYDEVFAGTEEEEERFVVGMMERGQRRDLDPDEIIRSVCSPAVGCKQVLPPGAGEGDDAAGLVPGDAFLTWLVGRYKVSRDQALKTANSIVLNGQLTLVGSTPDEAAEFRDDAAAIFRIARAGSGSRPGLRRMLSIKTSISTS